ncbi:hypothetical protein OAF27_01235 [Verrucomicrobiales bacterium]|nr:hypothetical protein [Verrucomicrobiales bacterium]
METIAYKTDGTITIPPQISEKLGWVYGLELEPHLTGGTLQLIPTIKTTSGSGDTMADRLQKIHRITDRTTDEILNETRSEV